MDARSNKIERSQHVVLLATRPDVVTLDQIVLLRPPMLTDPKAVWRWTYNGNTVPSSLDTSTSSTPLTVYGRPGHYAFEHYETSESRWVSDARWDVSITGGALVVAPTARPLGLIIASTARELNLPRKEVLRHFAPVRLNDTPADRWRFLAKKVAQSGGAVMPVIYMTSSFYWMPETRVVAKIAELTEEYGSTSEATPADATPLRRALDRALDMTELTAKADAIRVLLRDELGWWYQRINDLNAEDLLTFWETTVLSLDFFASVRTAADAYIDVALPADRARLYAWLAMHRAARKKSPHFKLLARLDPAMPPSKGGALPSASALARYFDLPLLTAHRILDSLRGDTPVTPPLAGVYAGAALSTSSSARQQLVAAGLISQDSPAVSQVLLTPTAAASTLNDGRVPESHMQTGTPFPRRISHNLMPGNVAGTVHYLWFQGNAPVRSQFVALAASNSPMLATLGRTARPVIRLPGTYSMWAMQQLRGERDDAGGPLIRWALLEWMHASGPALTTDVLLHAADLYVTEDVTLDQRRPFILPVSRLTQQPMSPWLRQPLDGKGPLVEVPVDELRTLEPLPRDETALQGIYHTVQPIVEEPLLAAALAASAMPLDQTAVTTTSRADVIARLDTMLRELAETPLSNVRSVVLRFFQYVGADMETLERLALAEQARDLLVYYRAMLSAPFGAQLLPDETNAQPVLDLAEELYGIAEKSGDTIKSLMRPIEPDATPPRVRNPELSRLALVAHVTQFAPGYLPLVAQLLTSAMDSAAFLAAIDEYHVVLVELLQTMAVQAAAVDPQLSTADVRQQVEETVRKMAEPFAVPSIAPASGAVPGFTSDTRNAFLRGLERVMRERARQGGAGAAPPLTRAFRGTQELRVTLSVSAHLGAPISTYATDAGGAMVLAVGANGGGGGGTASRQARVNTLLRTLLQTEAAAMQVPLPVYVHVVVAAPPGIDATTGAPYDVTEPRAWGDSTWRASEALPAHAPPHADAVATWFASRTEPPVPGVRPAPLFLVLWEGAQRDWPAHGQFAAALAKLETFAEVFAAEVARSTGYTFELRDMTDRNLYAKLVRLYPLPTPPSSLARPPLKQHPALESGGTSLALDYVRSLTRGALLALAHQYGLEDALPDLHFVEDGRRLRVPETAWIGEPSSWHVGPVLDRDIVGQALDQLALVTATRDNDALSPKERARRIAMVRAQSLHWNSRLVDLHPELLQTRHATWLVNAEEGVPSARLPWPNGGGPPNLAAGLGSNDLL